MSKFEVGEKVEVVDNKGQWHNAVVSSYLALELYEVSIEGVEGLLCIKENRLKSKEVKQLNTDFVAA